MEDFSTGKLASHRDDMFFYRQVAGKKCFSLYLTSVLSYVAKKRKKIHWPQTGKTDLKGRRRIFSCGGLLHRKAVLAKGVTTFSPSMSLGKNALVCI